MFNHIKNYQSSMRAALSSNFGQTGDQPLEKAITTEEFDEKYSVGYDVFTQEGVDAFKAACLEKGSTTEEIDAEVGKLEKVLIKKGVETVTLLVQKITPQGEEDLV